MSATDAADGDEPSAQTATADASTTDARGLIGWHGPAGKTVHFRPAGWTGTACQRSPETYRTLVYTAEPHQVDCQDCLRFMQRSVGMAALHADAIREMTAITLDIATKNDIAELKEFLSAQLRELAMQLADNATRPPSRYLNAAECAAYMGRSVKSIHHLVFRRGIPFIKVHGRVQFDRERIDRWMERHARRDTRGRA